MRSLPSGCTRCQIKQVPTLRYSNISRKLRNLAYMTKLSIPAVEQTLFERVGLKATQQGQRFPPRKVAPGSVCWLAMGEAVTSPGATLIVSEACLCVSLFFFLHF